MLVAELYGLLPDDVGFGDVRGALDFGKHGEEQRHQEKRRKQAQPRKSVRAAVEDLRQLGHPRLGRERSAVASANRAFGDSWPARTRDLSDALYYKSKLKATYPNLRYCPDWKIRTLPNSGIRGEPATPLALRVHTQVE